MSVAWRSDFRSWGRTVAGRHEVVRPPDLAAARAALGGMLPVLAYGNGRSYGDCGLNPDGRLIDCRGLDRFIGFDPETGVLACEAGVTLADILAVICRPEAGGGGWFLPVTPGTRFVTVGGAIANDVHGKNHHGFGTFGRHVLGFDLARSDGSVLACSPEEHAALFSATVGGMGLTGLILRARLQLRRVAGLALDAEDIRFGSLGGFFALARESDGAWEYTAAWVDCLASGRALGRGVFSRARHAPGRATRPASRLPAFGLPELPRTLATRVAVRAANAAYWRKPARRRVGSYVPVLYPLDAVGGWNRLYGPAGFFQFQCVVPPGAAEAAVADMLRAVAASGEGSLLSVLKLFGAEPSPGLMSFPMPGATLTLDFPNRGASTRRILARLEQITIEAGGRLYPAKDAVMTPASFAASYPQIDRFLPYVDHGFSSSLARRVGLVQTPRSGTAAMPDSRVVAIFGATSDIAAAVARRYAEAGTCLLLVGRNAAGLAAQAADLATRGAGSALVQVADFADLAALPGIAAAAWERFGRIDVALVAYGAPADQAAAEQSASAAEAVLRVNFESPVLLLGALARRFEERGGGVIAAITSVAGDRGRRSNHVYGAAKAGLQCYLEGLRHRLHRSGVAVLDIRPGFVSTRMTAHLNRSGPLWATADRVAGDIVGAIARRRAVLYTPWFWRAIMAVVRVLPRPLFHRTSL